MEKVSAKVSATFAIESQRTAREQAASKILQLLTKPRHETKAELAAAWRNSIHSNQQCHPFQPLLH